MSVKMMKVVIRLLILVTAFSPFWALADIASPPTLFPRDYPGELIAAGLLVASMILGTEILLKFRNKMQNSFGLFAEEDKQGETHRTGWKRNAVGWLAWFAVVIVAPFVVFPIASCFEECEADEKWAKFAYLGIVLLALFAAMRWREKKSVLPTRRDVAWCSFAGAGCAVWLVVVAIITIGGSIACCILSCKTCDSCRGSGRAGYYMGWHGCKCCQGKGWHFRLTHKGCVESKFNPLEYEAKTLQEGGQTHKHVSIPDGEEQVENLK